MVLAAVELQAQQAVLNKQRHFSKTIPAGNYSGITWLGGNRYALVDDKSQTAGFHVVTIHIDADSGELKDARSEGFKTNGQPNRDEEGICYVPQTQTLFVSSESDGKIVEYDMEGQLTGRTLNIPPVYQMIYDNRGFEALTYNGKTHRFWTTTENTLKADGRNPNIRRRLPNVLRLQSFDDTLQPREQYWYVTDSITTKASDGKNTLGVSGLAALDDGQLVVLEREIHRTPKNIGSYVNVKLYVVNPVLQEPGDVLQKQLLIEFSTRINLTNRSFANYEGLCAGPRLNNGRQLLMLVADSQNQYKGYLKDWFATVVMPDIRFVPDTTSSAARRQLVAFYRTMEDVSGIQRQSRPFLTKEELPDCRAFLTDPPGVNSEAFGNDTYYYEWGKKQRSTARGLQATIDELKWASRVFSPAAGFFIGPEESPEIFKLVEGASKDASAANKRAKRFYRRTRPFVHFEEPSLVPELDSIIARGYSYPSGHSVRGWTYAFTLALVVPDSTEALISRARDYAVNRVICGRHYKSDVDASLLVATAVMSRLLANKEFLAQLERARKEYQKKQRR